MKALTHRKITELAVDEYVHKYAGSELAKVLKTHPAYKQALLRGTQKEDDPTVQRASNWHFYPANDALQGNAHWLGNALHFTSLPILRQRQQTTLKLLNSGASSALFMALGRVMHHIQDMSTPSHVTPVYHGVRIHDRYERYLDQCWSRIHDKLDVPAISAALDHQIEEVFDEADSEQQPEPYFLRLYHQAANRLLDEVVNYTFSFTVNHTPCSANLTAIWHPYDAEHPRNNASVFFSRKRGFGQFGPIGLHYGQREFVVNDDYYDVDEAMYAEVAVMFVRAAISDSLKALLLLELLINKQRWDRPFSADN